jgi:hypothetical protein
MPRAAPSAGQRSHPYRRPNSANQEPQSRLGTLFSYAAAPLKWGASLFLSAEAVAEEAEEDEGAPAQPLRAQELRPWCCALSGLAGTHSLPDPQGYPWSEPRLPLRFCAAVDSDPAGSQPEEAAVPQAARTPMPAGPSFAISPPQSLAAMPGRPFAPEPAAAAAAGVEASPRQEQAAPQQAAAPATAMPPPELVRPVPRHGESQNLKTPIDIVRQFMMKDKRNGGASATPAAERTAPYLPEIDAVRADDDDGGELSAFRAPPTKAAQGYGHGAATPSFLLGTPGGAAYMPAAPRFQLCDYAAPTAPRPAATWLTSVAGLPSAGVASIAPSGSPAGGQFGRRAPGASPLAPPPSAKRDRGAVGIDNPQEPSTKARRLASGALPLVSSSASSVAAQRILRTLDMLDTPLRHTRPTHSCAVQASAAASQREAAKEAAALPSARGDAAPPLHSFVDGTPTRLLTTGPPTGAEAGPSGAAAAAAVPAVPTSAWRGAPAASPPLMPPAGAPMFGAFGSAAPTPNTQTADSPAAAPAATFAFGSKKTDAPAAAKPPAFGGFSLPVNEGSPGGTESGSGFGQVVPLLPSGSAPPPRAPPPASLKAAKATSHRTHASAPPLASADASLPAPSPLVKHSPGGFSGFGASAATPGASAAKPFASPAPSATTAQTPGSARRFSFTASQAQAAQLASPAPSSLMRSPSIFSFSKKKRATAAAADDEAAEAAPKPSPVGLAPFKVPAAATPKAPAGLFSVPAFDALPAIAPAAALFGAAAPPPAAKLAAAAPVFGFGGTPSGAATGAAPDDAADRTFGNAPLAQQQATGAADRSFGNSPLSQQKPAAGLFGAAATPAADKAAAPATFAFGAPAATPAADKAAAPATFAFGAPAATPAADKGAAPATFAFGAAATPAADKGAAPATFAFGAPAATPAADKGAAPATFAFGAAATPAPATPLFGAPAAATPAAAGAASLFGAPLFGGAVSASAPPPAPATFNFGAAAAGPPAEAATPAAAPPAFAFGGGSAAAIAPPTFGGGPAAVAAPPVFGGFGAAAAAPSAPTFSFGAPASAGASQPPGAFAFGGAAAAAAPPTFGAALPAGASQPPAFGAPSTAAAMFGGSSLGVPGASPFGAGSLAAPGDAGAPPAFSVGTEAGTPAGRAIRKFKRPSGRGGAR